MKKLALFLIVTFTVLGAVQVASARENTKSKSENTGMSMWDSFKPETLKGKISIIEPGKKAVFLSAANGVSYQFLVTPKTRIQVAGAKTTIAQLADQANEHATVVFVARPQGDFARSITVSS
jgi:hypothetical protein